MRVTLRRVGGDNWREVAALEVTQEQREWVSEPSYYLLLCHYEDIWQPLAIYLGEQVIGFLMWAIDPADGSCWLGGIMVDRRRQGRGYGRRALKAAISLLSTEQKRQQFALSYNPSNEGARHLYLTFGFKETGEWADDEVVARLSLPLEKG